ncbi:iron complex transport system substrate-binding protein [Stackebrandtia albiflava]|uniref:Iron complex transport system substrate-binding protein n=1 Tax=Stackebrandtia albiflava TaxID=406432 RepID=A0A562VBP4_9ACTN|nr:ABC transporter substrate-binding protein [Stackebrandtia albiflava]TWJ15305.1 iron complex transport system substrate-binding protein [Stackebrandtia albiflava]
MRHRTVTLLAVPVLAVSLAGCGGTDAGAADAAAGYPVTVENCGTEVVFPQAPERVVLLESAPVTILDGLGVLDRVVSRAGSFAPEYYSDDLNARISEIPALSEDIDAAGHLMLSQEVVMAEEPDLVLGLPDGMTREGLADAGANVLIQDVYCTEDVAPTTFDTLYSQIETYGRIFDRQGQSADLVDSLRDRVAAVTEATADAPERTAAVLYPTVGGGPLYTYGTASMAQPQLEAAGFTNVFADSSQRVFEVSVEELIDRDPDVLILLGQGDLSGLAGEITALPGADSLRALADDQVLVQSFNFTEPPSPLAVDGLERIVERFGTGG